MKKYLMTALVLVASASLFTASAASKKKNVKKVTPGMLMASMRLNIPTVFCSGGPMEAQQFPLAING